MVFYWSISATIDRKTKTTVDQFSELEIHGFPYVCLPECSWFGYHNMYI